MLVYANATLRLLVVLLLLLLLPQGRGQLCMLLPQLPLTLLRAGAWAGLRGS